MGVQGLFTLLENHREIYRDVRFRRRRLVIDGNNLLFMLYFDSGLDQNHGGDYAAFEVLTEKFVKNLKDCKITQYMVLDGGADYTDKKYTTLLKRTVDRIKKAHRAAEDGRREGILPLLLKRVFKQTLARLEVPMVQCYGEADQEIAALAKEWECPVLSKDSDFYIFDLPAGLLPLSDFKWQAVQQSGSKSYIPCKSYSRSSFSTVFNIQLQMLPAFAALAGNDYVKLERGEAPAWEEFAPKDCEISQRLEGLIVWLRRFREPQKAFEATLGLMGGQLSMKRREEVLKGLNLGMEEYKLPPNSLKKFFIHGSAPPLPTAQQVVGRVPDWTRLPLTQARLTPDILDVLLLGRMPLSCPVDRGDMPSAHLISRPIRQVMYGLLLGGGKEVKVDEWDRDGVQLKRTPVQPDFTRASRKLQLNSLHEAAPSQRLQVFLEALGVTEDSLSVLPSQLRLPVAVTCYWLQRAQPPPDEELLKALLLGLSTEDPLGHKAALQVQNPHRGQKPDVVVVNFFNQWQSCLKASIQLNQLLSFPLPEPQVSRLYEGTLVHQLVHRMRSGGNPQLFPEKYRSSENLYQTMHAVVHQFHRTGQRATAPRRRQPLDDLTANLKLLLLYDNEDEAALKASSRVQEDLHLNDLVSVKTRYRGKTRNNRCKEPELARKKECRGFKNL